VEKLGHIVMFGLGGIYVEVLGDVSFGITPLTPFEVRGMIESLRGYAVLAGVRGKGGVHVAALADIVPSIKQPLEYYRSNVTGTVNVLEASRRAEVARFVYSASGSCYGVPDVFPTPETAPIRPEYTYALTKYVGEECVMHWGKVYDLPVVSLRLANVYGPRSRTSGTYGAVFGVFLAQKLHNQPFSVVGDGTQTRDFVYVTDAIRALVMAAESGLQNEVFNVGSGGTYSINRLVELLGGDVVYVPKRPGEPDCTHVDISKIRRLVGWEPEVSFDDGVREMLRNIEYWRDAPVWTPDRIEEATKEWFTYLGGDKVLALGEVPN